MFQWESYVSLGVLIIVIIVPRSVFTKSSSIKLCEEDKRLLFDFDPWPPAEQKLEMPCDTIKIKESLRIQRFWGFTASAYSNFLNLSSYIHFINTEDRRCKMPILKG